MLKPPIRNTSNFKKFTLLCKKIVNNKLVSARSWQSPGKQCLSCLVLTAIVGLYSRIYPCLVRMLADVGTDVVLVIAMVSCWEHIRTTNSTLVYISGSRSLSKQMFSIDQRAFFAKLNSNFNFNLSWVAIFSTSPATQQPTHPPGKYGMTSGLKHTTPTSTPSFLYNINYNF